MGMAGKGEGTGTCRDEAAAVASASSLLVCQEPRGGGRLPASRATSSTAGGDPWSSAKSPYPTAAPARLLRVLSVQAPSGAGCLEGEMPCWAPQQVLGCSRVCVPRGASARPCRRWAPHRLAFPSSLALRCPVFIMQREITELVDFCFPFWTLLSSGAGLVRGPKHPAA